MSSKRKRGGNEYGTKWTKNKGRKGNAKTPSNYGYVSKVRDNADEINFIDMAREGTITNTVGASSAMVDPITANCLNAVKQGSGPSERSGRKTVMLSVEIEGRCWTDGATGRVHSPVPPQILIALVEDKGTNAVQCTSEQIYENKGAKGGGAGSLLRNMTHMRKYNVLSKKTYQMPPIPEGGVAGSIGGSAFRFKIYKKFHIPCSYIGDGETVSSILDSSLHLAMFSSFDHTTADRNVVVNFSYNSRVRFIK